MVETNKIETIGMEKRVETYRGKDPDADRWANGFGRIIHSVETQWRVFTMADWLAASGVQRDRTRIF